MGQLLKKGGECRVINQTVDLLDLKYRPPVLAALGRGGANRDEMAAAIRDTPAEHRDAVAFLIANMPDRDLTSLSGTFLRTNIALAFQARAGAPWGEIPEDIFLNAVLPYAHVNERRDDWRKDFANRFTQSAWACETPSQAALKLNQEVFDALGVTYHATKRPKCDQSPYESAEAGFASCTGLSIILANACRAAGIPARLAGVPMWLDGSGNHTWVEIWDGRWRYIGAWDGDKDNLDTAWFTDKAAACVATVAADQRQWSHRIFAASFRKTPIHFPLDWDPTITYVPAEDVTRRYAVAKGPAPTTTAQ